jgi:FtsP/CotA-like multicopper oxidase with cupredoxin domain
MAKMTLNLISVLGLLVFPFYVEGALQTFNLTLSAGWAAPDGYWRQVFLINDQFPGPLIEVDEGDDILVNIQNNLPVDNSIHWHGTSSSHHVLIDSRTRTKWYCL